MSEKRRLEVDLGELAVAMDSYSYGMNYYLDLETGRVVMVTDETDRELEEILDKICDEDGEQVTSLADYLQGRDDMRDWVKESLLEAGLVEQGDGTRFIGVEPDDSRQGYRDMERFIATVDDPRLQDHLWSAIRGRRAFRYFKDVLLDHPAVRERWFEFKGDQIWQRMLDWLDYLGIEPISSDTLQEEGDV